MSERVACARNKRLRVYWRKPKTPSLESGSWAHGPGAVPCMNNAVLHSSTAAAIVVDVYIIPTHPAPSTSTTVPAISHVVFPGLGSKNVNLEHEIQGVDLCRSLSVTLFFLYGSNFSSGDGNLESPWQCTRLLGRQYHHR